MEEISQTERYRSGVYRDEVLRAVRHRADIDAVLARHRTRKSPVEAEAADDGHAAQEAEAMADSVANDDEGEAGAGTTDVGYFPFKPYCRDCGRDTTTVTAYDDETTDLAYTCSVCDYHGTTNLATQDEGKLVWKADWPMRWAFEHVDFEPAGMDHATPGSSFTVGHELVESVWDYPRPAWFGYGFVGFAGVQKMSSSAGGAPTAEDALRVLEPGILRWLYVRRQPKQTFDIEFGPEVVRLYDEWDALARKAAVPEKRDVQVLAYERAAATETAGRLPAAEVVVPFRMLSSVADVTAGSAEQISRIVGTMGHPHDSVEQLEPRLSRAIAWTEEFVPVADRTTVRTEPDAVAIEALSSQEREWLALLLQGLQGELELEPVTSLVYGVPKLARGMASGRRAHRRGEGRPEGVLPAAVPPARRCRARPEAADVDRGTRHRAREDPAGRLGREQDVGVAVALEQLVDPEATLPQDRHGVRDRRVVVVGPAADHLAGHQRGVELVLVVRLGGVGQLDGEVRRAARHQRAAKASDDSGPVLRADVLHRVDAEHGVESGRPRSGEVLQRHPVDGDLRVLGDRDVEHRL